MILVFVISPNPRSGVWNLCELFTLLNYFPDVTTHPSMRLKRYCTDFDYPYKFTSESFCEKINKLVICQLDPQFIEFISIRVVIMWFLRRREGLCMCKFYQKYAEFFFFFLYSFLVTFGN